METLWKAIKGVGIGTIALVLIGIVFFVVYYVRTDPETTVVTAAAFPSNLSPGFKPEQVVDEFLAAVNDIRSSESKPVDSGRQAELGLQAASAPREHRYQSLRAPIPAFEQEVKGVSLGMVRAWGIQARAKHFLGIDTIAANSTQGSRFSLFAALKDRPDFQIDHSWNVPAAGDPCSKCAVCAKQLAEAVLSYEKPRALIVSNNQKQQPDAFSKTVDLYKSARMGSDLKRDDYFAWADALRGTKDYDKAIEKYTEGLAKDPSFCAAHDENGYTYLLKYQSGMGVQNLDAAEQSYRAALGCNPQDAIALSGLGNVSIRKWAVGGKTEESLLNNGLELNERALKIDPQRAEAAVNIGYAEYMRGNKQQALDYFREISTRFPSNAALFLNFGFLLYRQYLDGADTLAEATDKTHRAWDLDTSSYAAANNLGFFYFESGDTKEAVGFWRSAYTLNSADPDVIAGLALGLYVSGQKDQAVSFYRQALQKDVEFRNPVSLEQKHFWSKKAVQSVVPLVRAAKAN